MTLVEEIRTGEEHLDRILRKHPKDGKGFYSRSDIIGAFRRLAPARGWQGEEREFVARLRMRPVRSLSGVTPVTVLTQPFPCPGRCVFCPSDVRMPKSYLSNEPGAQRAESHGFDPYRQTWHRLAAFRAIGHPVDKVELIILGGTWSFHPEDYRRWFVRRCFEAMNDFAAGCVPEARVGAGDFRRVAADTAPAQARGRYNAIVTGVLRERHGGRLLDRAPEDDAALARAQRRNETAASRCVGLSLETRPDCLGEAEVERIRRAGATKVQIGIQSLSDAVLARNRRGHDVAATRRALRLLRAAGFKLQAHWMPNLAGATPATDVEDFARLFDDVDFRPDELKIYPTSLVETAELVDRWRDGSWRPYAFEELRDLLVACLARVPEYCRVSRVIRDISSDDILVGNKLTNFREIAERELAARGGRCRDIRSREIRGETLRGEPELRSLGYRTSIGEERFLQALRPGDRLAGFARLALPESPSFLPELGDAALLREVHVYGHALALGDREAGHAQHRGLGGRLVGEAAASARAAGHGRLAVISAVGTRAWYRRLGFCDGELYQHLDLSVI